MSVKDKMEHRWAWIVIGCLVVAGIILVPVLYNALVIQPRIHYVIEYDVNVPNREALINEVENLNYTTWLSNENLGLSVGMKGYIDEDFVLLLKGRIENDMGFKWWPFYEHHLYYDFIAEPHPILNLTYSNDTIFSVKDASNGSLIPVEDYDWNNVAWYLNFTQVSSVYGPNSTVSLTDIVAIEMRLDYGYHCGNVCALSYCIDQYLILNEDLDVILIIVPHTFIIVS
jgi:hypothetical protein